MCASLRSLDTNLSVACASPLLSGVAHAAGGSASANNGLATRVATCSAHYIYLDATGCVSAEAAVPMAAFGDSFAPSLKLPMVPSACATLSVRTALTWCTQLAGKCNTVQGVRRHVDTANGNEAGLNLLHCLSAHCRKRKI